MSIEVARFLDNTEYSTNAIIIQRKSYCHSALRNQVVLGSFTTIGQYLIAKLGNKNELYK